MENKKRLVKNVFYLTSFAKTTSLYNITLIFSINIFIIANFSGLIFFMIGINSVNFYKKDKKSLLISTKNLSLHFTLLKDKPMAAQWVLTILLL